MPVEYQGIPLSSIFYFRGFGWYCVLFDGFAPLWNAASENRIDGLAGFSDPVEVEGVDSLATFQIVLTKWVHQQTKLET